MVPETILMVYSFQPIVLGPEPIFIGSDGSRFNGSRNRRFGRSFSTIILGPEPVLMNPIFMVQGTIILVSRLRPISMGSEPILMGFNGSHFNGSRYHYFGAEILTRFFGSRNHFFGNGSMGPGPIFLGTT